MTRQFKLVEVTPTGISAATMGDSNAPMYNLAGQQINNAGSNVYIQNGKKYIRK